MGGLPPKTVPNQFRFPLSKISLFHRLVAVLRVVEYEMADRQITRAFRLAHVFLVGTTVHRGYGFQSDEAAQTFSCFQFRNTLWPGADVGSRKNPCFSKGGPGKEEKP